MGKEDRMSKREGERIGKKVRELMKFHMSMKLRKNVK